MPSERPASEAGSDLSSAPPSPLPRVDDGNETSNQHDDDAMSELIELLDSDGSDEDHDELESSDMESESDSSEEEVKKGKKRARGAKSKKSKTKAKGKGKATKGKKSQRRRPTIKSKDVKPVKRLKVDPEDGRLIAHRPEWHDIPDWKGKTISPLMQMPADIMDRCFGMHQDLGMREYVALAGTCRYFRQFLDNDFFHHLWYELGIDYKDRNTGRYQNAEPRVKFEDMPVYGPITKAVHDTDSRLQFWMRKAVGTIEMPCNKPAHLAGFTPFTREIEDIYNPAPTPPVLDRIDIKPNHYVPRGSRAKWSREQYVVYKQERRRWASRILEEIRLFANSQNAAALKKTTNSVKLVKHQRKYTILAIIQGCRDGEKGPEKLPKGLPVVLESEVDEGDAAETGNVSSRGRELWEAWTQQSRISVDDGDGSWECPESDNEDERDIMLAVKSLPRLNKKGKLVVHDHWPSKYRQWCAEDVNEGKLNMTEAISKDKVTKQELLSLKHWLTTNPISRKFGPQQIYHDAAVEALSFRAHGEAEGHKLHMDLSYQRAKKLCDSRLEKRKKAIEDGTFVESLTRPTVVGMLYRDHMHGWCDGFGSPYLSDYRCDDWQCNRNTPCDCVFDGRGACPLCVYELRVENRAMEEEEKAEAAKEVKGDTGGKAGSGEVKKTSETDGEDDEGDAMGTGVGVAGPSGASGY